ILKINNFLKFQQKQNTVLNFAYRLCVCEVTFAIGKLVLNKSCGLDQITAEHLKFASHRLVVLLALCFTGMLIHGTLPSSMLSVLLVPVIKDKTGKISSIENYRLISLASVMSKVLEIILLD
uniref:Uncharacterized protein n=1 Tax=Cyprinus carpio TaxID=7962 RepID=A0A8C2IQZ7_CYPCA